MAWRKRNMPKTLTAPGTMIDQYELIQPNLFINSYMLGSNTCDGSSIVASMMP